ncbi:hypothetical protein QBC44DRAFT_121472 [Cladorrhinum sp. PSN332]|nr:hypothetical protein QBC44DRAFT_121472 [Cladorrhinum sp. PSN332]
MYYGNAAFFGLSSFLVNSYFLACCAFAAQEREITIQSPHHQVGVVVSLASPFAYTDHQIMAWPPCTVSGAVSKRK